MNDPRAQDPTSFYETDGPPALPVAEDVNDLPAASGWEGFKAGWRTAKDDWPGESKDVLISSYSPLIDAVKRETGNPETEYIWLGRSTAGVQEDRVFRDIQRIRAKNPDFLPGVPDSPDAFRASVTQKTKARRAVDLQTLERTEGLAGYAGGFVGAAADPYNLMTLPFGGFGSTVARRIAGEAAVNIAVEAVEQPMIAGERKARGETLSLTEAATNVAVAGVAGAVMQGVIVEPAAAFLKRRREGKLTVAEKAAVHVIEREAQVDATSPFRPGPATEVHRTRVDQAERTLNGEPPPRPARPISPTASRAQVKALIGRAESPNDTAKNPRSSATGRYQFVSDTWLRYYKRRFPDDGLTNSQILARRTDGRIQEMLMDDLMSDNERALSSIGARATPGNLYLAHFAGAGGAQAVLRAAPDTPVSRIMGSKAIKANPFLKGMTAEDLVRWAHRKVGGDPDAPVLRREQFGTDDEWASAQREVDAAEMALSNIRAREAGDIDMALSMRSDAEAVEPRALNPWQEGDNLEPVRLYRAEGPEPVQGAPAATRQYVDNEATARAMAGEQGTVYAIDVPAARVDEIASRTETGEYRVARDVADAYEQKTAMPSKATDTAGEDWIISRGMIPETGPSGYRVEQSDDGSFATIVLRGHDGRAKAGMLIPTNAEALENFGGVISYVSPNIRSKGVSKRMFNIARQSGLAVAEMSGRADLTPEGAAFASARQARSAPLRAEGAERFDDGINGPGARSVTQSLEHDLRLAAAANPDELVRVTDDGADIRLADVIEDLDADDAALSAARACMA